MLELGHLLLIELAALKQQSLLRHGLRLPRRGADILGTEGIGEHILDLLEGLAGGLRECDEHVEEHAGVEDAEEDVHLPADGDEGRGHEVGEREVEDPVSRGGERDGLAAHAEGVQFGGVNPRDRSPGGGEAGDEEVGAGDDGFGGGAGDGPGGLRGVVDAVGAGVVAEGGEQAGVGEHEGHHPDGAEEEGGPPAPAVDVEERRHCEEDVDDVLDRGRHEEVVARQAGHLEDVGYVVHCGICQLVGLAFGQSPGDEGILTHYVHAGQLGPDLSEDSDVGSPDHVGLDELEEGDVGVVALEFAHVFDVLEFADHEGAVGVAFAVDKSQHGVAFVPAVLPSEPTG